MPHFHIQWSGQENPDPVIFASYSEALDTADFIAKPYETFTIQRFDVPCPVCEKLEYR
jgi:hypothetical protein